MTEGHLPAFTGLLKEERLASKKKGGPASITGYMSTVLQFQNMYIGTTVPPYPFMQHVLRSYKRWEKDGFAQEKVQGVIPASDMQAIWRQGMKIYYLDTIQNLAMIKFAYSINGLDESSILYVATNDVHLRVRSASHLVVSLL